jgi:hypothetical protein
MIELQATAQGLSPANAGAWGPASNRASVQPSQASKASGSSVLRTGSSTRSTRLGCSRRF